MSNCKGCHDFGHCFLMTDGLLSMYNCPCRTCLVTCMCEKPCEIFADHYNKTTVKTED